MTGLMLAASQRGDDKARVGLAAGPLGLADNDASGLPDKPLSRGLITPCRGSA